MPSGVVILWDPVVDRSCAALQHPAGNRLLGLGVSGGRSGGPLPLDPGLRDCLAFCRPPALALVRAYWSGLQFSLRGAGIVVFEFCSRLDVCGCDWRIGGLGSD